MRSIPLGRAFGIPLSLHWTCLLLPLWPAFAAGGRGPLAVAFAVAALASMFGCVLLHELGHALMARAFGIATRDITLYPIGGVARLESTGHSPHQEVCIALAGPAVNLVLVLLLLPAVVALLLLGTPPSPLDGPAAGVDPLSLLATYLTVLCIGNGVLLAFNLVPAFPMDGGRVLRALLTLPMGLLRATEVAAAVGAVLAVGMVAFGLMKSMPMLALVGCFVVFAGQAELFGIRRLYATRPRRAGPPVGVETVLVSPPPLAVETVFAAPRPVETVPVVPLDPLDPTVPFRPVAPAAQAGQAAGFTGILWDGEQRVWVRWVDGRPDGVF